MLNLLSTNQSHILEKFFVSFLFIRPRSLCLNNKHVHLRREIDHNLQLAANRLYITEITKTGPRMDPCGTPHRKSAEVENL